MKKLKPSLHERYYEEYWKYRISKGRLHTGEDTWIPQRMRLAVDMIMQDFRRRKSDSISVLDVGCGEGAIGKLLREQFAGAPDNEPLLVGCDISKTVLRIASLHYTEVFKIDLEKDDFPEKLFIDRLDFIVLLDVLEHLFRPDIVLEKCLSILKDDGILVTSFPNIAWYKYRIELLKGHFPSDYLFGPSDHIQQFTLPSFTKLLERSGFNTEKIDGHFIMPDFFRPRRVFFPICRRFPRLFAYQLVVKARKWNRSPVAQT